MIKYRKNLIQVLKRKRKINNGMFNVVNKNDVKKRIMKEIVNFSIQYQIWVNRGLDRKHDKNSI